MLELALLAQTLTADPPTSHEEPNELFWFANVVGALALPDYSSDFVAAGCRDALFGYFEYGAAQGEELFQIDLLRDVFGNPFRPVAFETSWRTGTAVALAKTMYDARDFAAMTVLADALEEAGCDVPDVLSHCRDPKGVHVRGCWVVDLVLGKK
jgi:hypothetical protein